MSEKKEYPNKIEIMLSLEYPTQYMHKPLLNMDDWQNMHSQWNVDQEIEIEDGKFSVWIDYDWDEAMGYEHCEIDPPDEFALYFKSDFTIDQEDYQKLLLVEKELQKHRKNYRSFDESLNYRSLGKRVGKKFEKILQIIHQNLIVRFWQYDFPEFDLIFDGRRESLGGWFDSFAAKWREDENLHWKKFLPTALDYNWKHRAKDPLFQNYFQSGLISFNDIDKIQNKWEKKEKLPDLYIKMYGILRLLLKNDYYTTVIQLTTLFETIFDQEILPNFIKREFTREKGYFDKMNLASKVIVLLKLQGLFSREMVKSVVNLINIRNVMVHEGTNFQINEENLHALGNAIKLVHSFLPEGEPLPELIIANVKIL